MAGLRLLAMALLSATMTTRPTLGAAQALPDSLVEQIRAGAARLTLPADSTVVRLVGSPTLPLVEVLINGQGPYRFLIDLGANVVIVRRDIATAVRGDVLADRERSDIVRFAELRLGAARFERVTVGAYDTLDVDGVLGYNVLRYAGFTLDYPGQRLILHHRRLPAADGVTTFNYEVIDRLPFVRVRLGATSLQVNLDSGAAEGLTIPPAMKDSIRWETSPQPGPEVSNNQTGRTRVLTGQPIDALTFGPLRIPSPCVYINPDAETAWLGSASMQWGTWTFDPTTERLEVRVPKQARGGRSGCAGAG